MDNDELLKRLDRMDNQIRAISHFLMFEFSHLQVNDQKLFALLALLLGDNPHAKAIIEDDEVVEKVQDQVGVMQEIYRFYLDNDAAESDD